MDLKPKNILLSSSREPFIKIADFGFAQYLKPTDGATDLRGSPLYMAPEMFTSRSYDARVDLWSVGVIFYECLFGKAPYTSKSIEELVLKITDSSPVAIPTDVKISDNCCDLLKRLLQKDPRQRISFESFFAHPFLDFEHFPSEENNEKAAELAKLAQQFDKFEDYNSAIKKYLECLDYLVVALTYEKNEVKKKALKDKVQRMMNRTEELKQKVRSKRKVSTEQSPSSTFLHDIEYIDETSTDYLKRIFEDQPAIVAALESGCTAEYMESQGHDKVAVEYYEVAIERLIRFTKGMPFGDKRSKLQKQISDWLAKAEALNDNLKMFERQKEATPSPPVLEVSVSKPLMKDPESSIFNSCSPQ
ncbi:hypothetical protein RvY_08087-2 [Ramazzottius varieornatus]|uniref:non-specific serine/threonine protein kinase n=1 Tax=Ramazzottius varieornatus TaxID=947166 RepID=A0A1D1VCS4_RAMVA|nr:hypothetical protein RvY_08087-2 [Ramazzottius varieornatus]